MGARETQHIIGGVEAGAGQGRPEEPRAGEPGLAAALVAAGAARRFGRDKRFVPLAGRPLLAYPLRALLGARERFPNGVVVVADRASFAGVRAVVLAELREAGLPRRAVRLVASPDAAEGMAASLRKAAEEAQRSGARGLVVLLADMPLLGRAELAALTDAWRPGRIVVAEGPEGPTPPVVFPASDFASLAALRGDRGARAVWAAAPERTDRLALPGDWWRDVDTPSDLAEVEALLAARGPWGARVGSV
ncbi:MAG: nucleotidyltransferase family protein [Clostridia bacterium]|nr:nucleotidyltransferase family protein [Clostridia bacterium]